MSFNLRRRKESDGKNTWSARRFSAFNIFEKYAPDLVGTQEGLEDQVEDLLTAYPEYEVVGEARFGGRNDEFNAIFYKHDRFKVLKSGNFWHSDTPDVPGSRSWGNLVPRMATWAAFEERENGFRFIHLNTHLDHLVPAARRKGAELIASRIPANGYPVLVTGDFNAVPRGGTYRFMTAPNGAGFTDSRLLAENRNPFRWGATFHNWTGRGLYRIDYVFARGLARVHSHVVARDRLAGKLPSDHFPVVADLELRVAS